MSQNSNNKTLRGYISSREICGTFYPQSIQNLIIRNHAKENSINLQLSGTEWNVRKSFVMLRSLVKQKNDGIIFFSIFQIYDQKKKFEKIAYQIFKSKKIMIFSLENIILKNSNDLKTLFYKLKINQVINSKDFFEKLKKNYGK
jgi:sporadic carbohydrate cluster protein (TIGR04323 family)